MKFPDILAVLVGATMVLWVVAGVVSLGMIIIGKLLYGN